jgi:hypothetical protein
MGMFPAGGFGFTIGPAIWIAAVLTLIPLLAAAFFSRGFVASVERLPLPTRLLCPAVLCVPYLLVASSRGWFHWDWLALYALLPVAVAGLQWQAREADPAQRGNWRDFLVLAILGLAVDLRWFESAWPAHLAVFNKILLLDAGIYGFILVRQLEGVGSTCVCACATLPPASANSGGMRRSRSRWAWAWAFCMSMRYGRGR